MRSSGGSAHLVNDQTVQRKGSTAAATVVITFQKANSRKGVDATETADVSNCVFETWNDGLKVAVKDSFTMYNSSLKVNLRR